MHTIDTVTLASLGIPPLQVPIPIEPLDGQWDLPFDVPRIENLFELESLCNGSIDAEFWRWAAVAAARDIGIDVPFGAWQAAINWLKARRVGPLPEAEFEVRDAINLFLNRTMKGTNMPTKTAAKPKNAPKPQMTDDELLAWALGCRTIDDAPSNRALVGMQENGATDEQLYAELVIELSTVNLGSQREYAVEADEDRIRIWFDASEPTGKPDLESLGQFGKFAGKLLGNVRALLGIGEAKQTKSTEPDDDVLARSLSYDDGKFAKLRESCATDEQLLVAIRERWRKAPVNGGPGKRHYDVDVKDPRWGTAIWFDDDRKNNEAPFYCYRESTDGKRLDVSLLEAVRRVMNVPNVNGTPAKTTKPAAAKSKSSKSTDAPMGVKLGPIEQRPFSWFSPSRWQEREEHTEEWRNEQVESMKRFGQLEACVALPTGELISGHGRHEFGQLAGLPGLDVRIADVDDVTAQALVLFYNIQRRDLKLRERSRHYSRLLETYTARGLKLDDMAADLKKDQSTLSNEIRLSSLPDSLWKRQEAGGLTIEQARRLAIHAARPLFVEGVLAHFKTIGLEDHVQPEPNHFESILCKGIDRCFRPMEKDHFGEGCQFKPTADQREALEIVEVEKYGRKTKMAANVALWNELNKAAKKKKKDKAGSSAGGGGGGGGAPLGANAQVKENDINRRRQMFLEDSWDKAFAKGILVRLTGKLKKVDHPLVIRLAMLVQRESNSSMDDICMELHELFADGDAFVDNCLRCVLAFFRIDDDGMACPWEDLESTELRYIAKWLNVSGVEQWRPSYQLLASLKDEEVLDLLTECSLLPADQNTNIQQLLEVWTDGWVPDGFTLEKQPKPKGKK